MHDVIIKNGTIIDGTGQPMFMADLAINGGKITEIGDLGGEHARKEVDATDFYVAPGFVDISNRSDVYWRLFKDPLLEGLVRQGITTIIGGHSGTSLAPIHSKEMLLSTQKWADVRDVNVGWETMEEFLDAVAARHLNVNFGTLVGHGTLRRGMTGDAMRALTHHEIRAVAAHITKSIAEGAFGASVGLLYTHAQNTTTEELLAVGTAVKNSGGLFAAHLRDEEDDLIESLDEILAVTQATDVRTHITHLKAVGVQNWPAMSEALTHIEKMRTTGYDVSFDVYPYTHTGSVLYTFLPQWVAEGGKRMMLARLKNPHIRAQVIKELEKEAIDFDQAVISIAAHNPRLRGRIIGDIARKRGVSAPTVVLDLLLASEGRVIVLLDVLSEENIMRGLEHPYAIVTSNAPGYTLTATNKNDIVHPRSFGSFPRLLKRYVREQNLLSWELAIHKSTGKPAAHIGLTDRGLLKKDYWADVIVFDPARIADQATITHPMQYATGIPYVLINGILVIDDGRITGIRPGQVLRK